MPESRMEIIPAGTPRSVPRKGRALTDILRAVGEEQIIMVHPETGEELPPLKRMEVLARLTWHAVLTGTILLPDGKQLTVGARDILEMIKWMYIHMDGPAPRVDGNDVPDQNQTPIQLTDDQRARRIAEVIGLLTASDARPAPNSAPTSEFQSVVED